MLNVVLNLEIETVIFFTANFNQKLQENQIHSVNIATLIMNGRKPCLTSKRQKAQTTRQLQYSTYQWQLIEETKP